MNELGRRGRGMDDRQFSERMAQIRRRFAEKLPTKIADTTAALPNLTGEGSGVVDAVAAAYRRFHDLCGIAPTIGFTETGRVARSLDNILIGPFRAERGMTADETAKLKEGLDALHAAARIDMQSTDTEREHLP